MKSQTNRSLPIGTLRTKRKTTHFAKYFRKICLQMVRGLNRPVVTMLKHICRHFHTSNNVKSNLSISASQVDPFDINQARCWLF
jgi:hypothetical protein